jgi:hypothetical protein
VGLFDIFKKTEQPKTVDEKPDQVPPLTVQPLTAEPYLGDLNKTQLMFELCEVPYDQRDEVWQKTFLDNVAEASFACGDPQVIEGPDGFPYFHLLLPESGKKFQCYVVDKMKDNFLLKSGYGIVINANAAQPDWVFTYGDIVNLHLNKQFYTSEKTAFSTEKNDEVIQQNEDVLTGQPSEAILPMLTRQVLSSFLQTNGVSSPKIVLMQRNNKSNSEISQELVFNITPDNFENEETCRHVMQHLAWFLPRHYSYVGMRETALTSFMPL